MKSIGSISLLLDLCPWLLLSSPRYYILVTSSLSLSLSLSQSKPFFLFSVFIYTSCILLNIISLKNIISYLQKKMVQLYENEQPIMPHEHKHKRLKFHINDHIDVLIEILKRLDGRSLSVAASVCRLWCSITRNDSLWEHLCFRQMSPPPSGVRPVVVALGGYRRLYMLCVRPVLSRLGRQRGESDLVRRVWTRHEVELSLSLFCVDYYERLGSGGRLGGDAAASSLMFLCKAVNV